MTMATETPHDGMPRRHSADNAGQLPLPSSMSTRSASSSTSGERLIQLLQYLNPLYYARIAQSFLASVLEVYGLTGNQSAGRIANTGHDNGESMLGYESLHDEPAGTSTHQYVTASYLPPDVSDQITYLPTLNLGDEHRHSTLGPGETTPFTDAVLEPLSASVTPKASLDADDVYPSSNPDETKQEDDPVTESNGSSPGTTTVEDSKSPGLTEHLKTVSDGTAASGGDSAACDATREAALTALADNNSSGDDAAKCDGNDDALSVRSTQCSDTPTVRPASPSEQTPTKNKNRSKNGRKSKRNRGNRKSKIATS